MPTSSSLREFAICPAAYLPGTNRVDKGRYFLVVHPRDAVLTRLSFAPADVGAVLEEVRVAAPGRKLVLTTDRGDLADAFRALGFGDPAPPIEPTCTALALEHEPPAVEGIEVRRVESYDDFLAGRAIEAAAFGVSTEDPAAVWERRQSRPGGEWLTYVDGRPVGYGGAVAGERGLYLAGGATLPEARGRGAYRALVRARWDYAVELGTPALVVHAQETSRPILERLGFERVCTIHELELPA